MRGVGAMKHGFTDEAGFFFAKWSENPASEGANPI